MNGYAIFLAVLTITVTAANAEILKRELPMGALKEGQVVLIDDGTCPRGQVKRVVGGNHLKVGGTKHIVSTHSCVAR